MMATTPKALSHPAFQVNDLAVFQWPCPLWLCKLS
jgi:hypothetical protein